MDLDVIYEDNHLLVVNKPSGILTQPSGTSQENLLDCCKEWLKAKYAKPGAVFLEAAHRLDKQVSGIVLFAKTSKALSRLNQQSRSKEWKKIYRATVEPSPTLSEATLKHYIAHGDHCAVIVDGADPSGKEAILHYRILSRDGKQASLEIELETGRYHQIRAQLAAIGSPVLGDVKYGGKPCFNDEKIALHHHRLMICHPVKGEQIQFECLNKNKI